MSAKYLSYNSSGIRVEVEAIQDSTGIADAGKIPALGADGRLGINMMPSGIGSDTQVLPASEALSAGNYVNFWDDSGTTRIRKADGSDVSKKADGFVLASVASGENATVYPAGANTQLSGLAVGACWLSTTTPGTVQQTPPTGAGNHRQYLGTAVNSSTVNTQIGEPTVIA